jgi:predicted deacylase
LASGTELRIRYGVLNGRHPGPVLTLISALHGWEPVGTEIIRRVLLDLDPEGLRGAIVFVPIANPFSLEFGGTAESAGLQVSPTDMVNLNRVFPGKSRNGLLTERLAHCLIEEILRVSDVVLDFHDGTSSNDMIPLCTFFVYEKELGYPEGLSERTLDLAKAMGAQVGRRRAGTPPTAGIIGAACGARNVVTLMLSVGGLGIATPTIAEGIRCVHNLIRAMGLLDGTFVPPPFQIIVNGEHHRVLYTTTGGFFFGATGVKLGAVVDEGQPLGYVLDPLSGETREVVPAPFRGVIGMFRERMVTNPGGMVGHLASTDHVFWARGLPSRQPPANSTPPST